MLNARGTGERKVSLISLYLFRLSTKLVEHTQIRNGEIMQSKNEHLSTWIHQTSFFPKKTLCPLMCPLIYTLYLHGVFNRRLQVTESAQWNSKLSIRNFLSDEFGQCKCSVPPKSHPLDCVRRTIQASSFAWIGTRKFLVEMTRWKLVKEFKLLIFKFKLLVFAPVKKACDSESNTFEVR